MSTSYGGGGGGGFGGFPYRSAHQQGTDGRGRGGRRRARYPRKQKTPPSLLCAADIVIPANQRGRLIGRGGTTIKQLRESTGATIFVPNSNDNCTRTTADKRPVRIKATSVASLLHACWNIVYLGLDLEEQVSCKVRIPSNVSNLCGKVQREARFFVANNQSLKVYCVESYLDADEVDTIVDNFKFANTNANVQHETVYLQQEKEFPSTLIFCYGQEPEPLYQALVDETTSLWRQSCLSNIHPIAHNLPSGALTVATWNVLHPLYASKYKERPGLTKLEQDSNFTTIRAPAIASILLECNLDIYFLQEAQVEGLMTLDELTQQYHVISFVHPSREAQDSVAILLGKNRFEVVKQEACPFQSKQNSNQHYMCAATVIVKDSLTNATLALASTHFYTKKSRHPQTTLLEYLKTQSNEYSCDAVIWGGDCNDEYKRGNFPAGYFTVQDGQGTRGPKRIDWIFYSSTGNACSRSEATEAFVDATMKLLPPTGYPPSDHYGEALALNVEKRSGT